jgi:hypothetical protein
MEPEEIADKHVPVSRDIHAAVQELLETVFSLMSAQAN